MTIVVGIDSVSGLPTTRGAKTPGFLERSQARIQELGQQFLALIEPM